VDVQSFGVVTDLIPRAFPTNGSLFAADFLAYSRTSATGTAAFFEAGFVLVGLGWVLSLKRRWVGIVVGVAGGVLLILGLIQWQLGRSIF
jgi:hypothetical protein